jgi:iron only hydrogenase large subunit-like protein
VTGGVSSAVIKKIDGKVEVNPITINGLTRKSLKEMKRFEKKCPGNLVEVMACEGGCIAGPNVIGNPRLAAKHLKKYLGK